MIVKMGRSNFPELNKYLIANLINIMILISGEWFRVSRLTSTTFKVATS